MKIENYSLSLRAEHATTFSKTTLFETELQTLDVEREQERLQVLEQERQLVARLQYELLNRLLMMFGGCRCRREATLPAELPETGVQVSTLQRTEVRITERRFESQRFEASMTGCIQTDSRSIAIDINLSMSRTFVSEREISSTLFYDPLVINFDGEIPELSNTTFSFDIDNDGREDQISELGSGSGFLALDKNGNGTIDAGCELFGTEQGNGFVELSMHDADGNHWIDENDPVFERLRIWTVEGESRRLIGLGEAGIGAIYLASAYTPMEYRNAENEALGRLKATGLFLYEDGRSGTVGEMDFAAGKADGTEGLGRALAALEPKAV